MQLSPGALSSMVGRVQSGIENFDQIQIRSPPKQIHHRRVNKENTVNGNNAMKTPIRSSLLPQPQPTSARGAGMVSLLQKLQSDQNDLLEKYDANTDKLINVTSKGFNEVNRALALQHSSQKTHHRNADRKMDRLLSEYESQTAEMKDAMTNMTKQMIMLQQLSASKTNIPSSITASTDPSSSAMTSVRSVLFCDEDAAPSIGNSTLSKPTLSSKPHLPVVPSTETNKSQDIENILLGKELEKSQAANAALEQEIRSLGVKFEQQEKRMKSMTAPPGHRDVMDIKPTPTEHSERTNKSINKAVKTIRRGNKNRDIAPTPTRRSARNRPSVKKDP